MRLVLRLKIQFSYTAEMNGAQRDAAVTQFIEDPDCRIFQASTLAAGEGLDGLQRVAEDCILLERQWNPKKEEQAEKRVQRIGAVGTGDSEKKIIAHYILSDGTIDEYFTELVEKKRAQC
jgi:SNF2 family DNA or RNA helicase